MVRTLPNLILTLGLGVWLFSGPCRAQGNAMAWLDMDRSMLQVAVELASGTAPGADREKLIDALYDNLEGVDGERTFAQELLAAAPEDEFKALVAAEGERPLDYLIAARRSYSRL